MRTLVLAPRRESVRPSTKRLPWPQVCFDYLLYNYGGRVQSLVHTWKVGLGLFLIRRSLAMGTRKQYLPYDLGSVTRPGGFLLQSELF